MKLKEGFTIREICGVTVLVPEGLRVVSFNKLVNLNSSAKYLWQSLEGKDFEVEDMVKLLTDEYEVTEELALEDAKRMMEEWQSAGLTTE